MSEKTIKDRIINLLLSLYIIDKVNTTSSLENNLKLQKLIFLSQKQLIEKQKSGFRYLFIRWNQGPFSANLNEDLKLLQHSKFINWGKNSINLTTESKQLMAQLQDLFNLNKTYLKSIDSILEQYSSLTPTEIKEHVYNIKIRIPRIGTIMRIEDIPHKKPLLVELSKNRARHSFDLPEEWLETLEVVFDWEAMNLLKQADNDAIAGRTNSLNAV